MKTHTHTRERARTHTHIHAHTHTETYKQNSHKRMKTKRRFAFAGTDGGSRVGHVCDNVKVTCLNPNLVGGKEIFPNVYVMNYLEFSAQMERTMARRRKWNDGEKKKVKKKPSSLEIQLFRGEKNIKNRYK